MKTKEDRIKELENRLTKAEEAIDQIVRGKIKKSLDIKGKATFIGKLVEEIEKTQMQLTRLRLRKD